MASPQLELLHCATVPPDVALKAWQRLLATVSVEDFDYRAQRLLPAVWVNLKKASKSFPEEPRLRGIHRRTWVHNKRLTAAAGSVLELLAGEGIPTLVLKGLAYNELLYGDSGVRPSWDFDILIPFHRAPQAIAVLETSGWRFKQERLDPSERLEHGATLTKDGLEFDLHWNLMREARNPEQDLAIWKEAVPLSINGHSTLTLSPTHQLFYLLAIANREPDNKVRYLLDLLTLTRVLGAQIDYERAPEMLAQRRIASRISDLPLDEIGLGQLKKNIRPSNFDRLWSQASGYVFDGSHEGYYLLYPFLDYWLHYRGRQTPNWGFLEYMRRRLKVENSRDFFTRTVAKLWRMVISLWR